MSTSITSPNAGYAPPQWVLNTPAANSPPLTILAQPSSSSTLNPTSTEAEYEATDTVSFSTTATAPILYVFDNALFATHEQDLAVTNNPVQTQAVISDHSYLQPARLTIQILMSDAMRSYSVGQFTGTQSRSVSAYQTLLTLQASQTFLQVSTRLRQYSNMLILSIRPEEDSTTRYGLKCTVVFQEILVATTQTVNTNTNSNSANPQINNVSQAGQVQSVPVPPTITSNYSGLDAASQAVINTAGNGAAVQISNAMPPVAQTTLTQASGISSNINQFPTSIVTVANSNNVFLPTAASTIAGLSITVNALAAAYGAKVPISVIAPVTTSFATALTVQGAGVFSSNNVASLATVLAGVNRF